MANDIKATNENFDAYLNRVKDAFPEGFDESLGEEGLTIGATGYVFVSFMNGLRATTCASELVRMNGVKVT